MVYGVWGSALLRLDLDYTYKNPPAEMPPFWAMRTGIMTAGGKMELVNL